MAALASHVTFRVTGLPTGEAEDIIASLTDTINQSLSLSETGQLKFTVSAIPSCDNEHTSAALVDFKNGVPVFLNHLEQNPLEEWAVETDEGDINFDKHFFGFTQLYPTVPGKPVTADIIAIAGLDGHAYGSWKGKGNLGRMWLRDFLSKDLPHCRTMIYGYNSKLSSQGIDTIMDYSREFMEGLKAIRNTLELRQRPLIFVAHSFGGIIVAHILVKAVQTNEEDHPAIAALYKATYGILFFATPHKGLMIEDIQSMLDKTENHPRNILLQQIGRKSDLLMSQLVDFKNLIRDRKIVSFYETEQTRRLEWDSTKKRWRRTGPHCTSVDTDSSILELPGQIETAIPLHSDHSRIVKFDNKNALGYRFAIEKLKEFEQHAPKTVSSRFSRQETYSKASSTVPFRQDPNFVGRQAVMRELDEKLPLPSTHQRIALVGLGGMGKSQIAIEYSYRLRYISPTTWVFWVHASSLTRFEQGYRDIAVKLELPGRDDPKTDILTLVSQWLRNESNGTWLLILDNADDDKIFTRAAPGTGYGSEDEPRLSLLAHIPQTSTGSILVTSRNRVAAFKVVGNHECIIDIKSMDENDALALFQNKLACESSPSESYRLLHAVEHIPLAITQAAAYISINASIMSVSEYLDLFLGSESNQITLLNEDTGDLRRDPEVPNAVITTWQISFDQLRKNSPDAADLLSLMSVLNSQGIPESLLLGEDKDRLTLKKALAPLIAFSLVKPESGGETFEIHRLVQLATRKWLDSEERCERVRWNRKALRLVLEAFPAGNFENWAVCTALLPHVEEVSSYGLQEEGNILMRASILYNLAWYLWTRGNFQLSESKVEQALNIRSQYLSEDDTTLASTYGMYGLVLRGQGKYEAAEEMHRRALTLGEKVLGPEHPSTLTSMNNLASVLDSQGKYEAAEEMHRRALTLSEKVLGLEHSGTLTIMNNLASVLDSQGKYEAAEEMHRRELTLSEKVLGLEHPGTLTSMNNLASVLDSQGKYEAAEEMHRRVLTLREKVLGPEHPDTLTSVYCLAYVLHSQRQYNEATVLYEQACAGFRKSLGANHPTTISCLKHHSFMLEEMEGV